MTGETIEIGKTGKMREKIEKTKKEKENLARVQSSPKSSSIILILKITLPSLL